LLQLAESPFGRADQVINRRIALTHLSEDFLGGNAAVHYPDALGFAVLRFNLVQKLPQRGSIGGVARQHFVGQREPLGSHDQRDDHLHAVRTLVSAVSVAPLVVLISRSTGLEISAGKIVEQNVKLGAKQTLPSLGEMTEQRWLVFHHFVQTAIQRIFLHQ
jgi:hypothetical protein